MAWLTTPSIWYRRKPKIIRGSTVGAQTNYQLKLTIYKGSGTETDTDNTIYLGGHVNNDFSDLRFTSSDEITLLPYWIESYISGISAVVWVKIDSIPVDPLTKTIYIYYDNLVASPGSNGTNTFLLFDDFSINTSGNYSQFDVSNYYGMSPIPATITWNTAGFLQIGSLNTRWHKVLNNLGSFDKNIAVELKLRFDALGYDLNNNGGIGNVISRTTLSFVDNGHAGGHGSYPSTNQIAAISLGIGAFSSVASAYTTGVWYKFILTAYNTELKFYRDDILKISATNTTVPSSGYVGVTVYDSNTSIDDLRVRKFVSPEPVFSTTSPEQIYMANLAVSSTPTGAEIWINNTDQGVTTTGWFILNPGTYTIMLTKPGYEDYIEIITLSSNQNAIVQGNLISATGNLDISSTPSGAEIFLAPTGSPLVDQGIVTPNIISLTPLTYDYKLTHIDYYDATGSFTIMSGFTTTLNILLTHLPCPTVTKNMGDILTLEATPIQGVAPYAIQFRKSPAQSIGNDETAATEIIPHYRIPGGNNVSGVPEGTTITRIYTLDDIDLEGATTKSGDTGPSIIFATEMIDSCTPSQSCIKYCKIFVGCTIPVCDFTVT